jgi:hypothetical protein
MRAQSLWDGSADYILALLEDMAGLGAVARFLFRRKEPEYLWFGIAMLFNSVGKLAGPIFYQRLFQASWSRLLEIGIALIIADLVIGLVYTLSGFTAHIWAAQHPGVCLWPPDYRLDSESAAGERVEGFPRCPAAPDPTVLLHCSLSHQRRGAA